jgi:hypothetical protein
LSSVNLQFSALPSSAPLRSISLTPPIRLGAGALFAIVAIGPSTETCGIFFGPPGDTYPRGRSFYDARPDAPGWIEGAHDLPFQTVMAP